MSFRAFHQAITWLLSLGTVLWLSGCAESPETSKVSGEALVRLPWNDGQGGLKLQEVRLKGLENLLEVRGAHARFYYAPKLQPGGLEGASPKARFVRTKSDLYVPADELSQQMAVVYAHLQNLREMDREAGLGDLLTWPRKVGISTRIRNADGSPWTDNSFYDGASDSILLVPNKKGRWPLATNPGVIAHEHFHALFYRLVLGPLLKADVLSFRLGGGSAHAESKILESFAVSKEDRGEKLTPRPESRQSLSAADDRIYKTAFVKIVNEGLADVWAWIYSGQPDFVAKSFPAQAGRSLRAQGEEKALSSDGDIIQEVGFCLRSRNPDGCVNNYAYKPGSELSRALRSIFLGDVREGSVTAQGLRKSLAARIAKSLPSIRSLIEASNESSRATPEKILQVILEAYELSSDEKAEAAHWVRIPQ